MLTISSTILVAQEFPEGFVKKITENYHSISKEIINNELKMTLSEYIAYQKYVFNRDQESDELISSNRSTSDLCANGTFETGDINNNDWFFVWSDPSNAGYTKKNTGAFDGDHFPTIDKQVHHQVQSSGVDPWAPLLSKVWSYPTGNTKSLRIGNAVNGQGYASVAKKVTITPTNANLSFCYAAVMNNPIGHDILQKPYFQVNIYEKIGPLRIYHNSLINLGGGSNTLLSNDPLLKNSNLSVFGSTVKYKDWACVQVDLSSLIGKTIYIKFEARDCDLGAHMGYAYIDNLCLGCEDAPNKGGTIKLGSVNECGIPGKICINYTLPQGNATGKFDLQLIQNGLVLNTITSPSFSSGSSYCFDLNNTNSSGINQSLGAIDFKIIGNFTLNNISLTPQVIGNQYDGINADQNNDYIIECPSPYNCCNTLLNITQQQLNPVNNYPNGPTWNNDSTPFSIASDRFTITTNSIIPITEMRAVVTDIDFEYDLEACAQCIDNPANWGSLDYVNTNRIGNPNTGLEVKGFQGYSLTDRFNQRELIWENEDGAMLSINDYFDISYTLPPLSEIPCCVTKVKICIEISYKDANCNVCTQPPFCKEILLSQTPQKVGSLDIDVKKKGVANVH